MEVAKLKKRCKRPSPGWRSSTSSGNPFNLVILRACLGAFCLVKLGLAARLRKSHVESALIFVSPLKRDCTRQIDV